jgi:ectoine hydroxylase-related dioxygenase (phytanoyl-CoA dioxygenase family)
MLVADLKPSEVAHFRTFGFLLRPRLFTEGEMSEVTEAANALWEADDTPESEIGDRRLNSFVERLPVLSALVCDDRIYKTAERLLGPDFIWVGSEGNETYYSDLHWHPDRKYYRPDETHNMAYPQLKMMIYLESVTRETGCMRVLPGSHQLPLHQELGPQEDLRHEKPFGLEGCEVPSVPLETDPGDVAMFDHCLWHGMFGGRYGRRYIAMKFAARPRKGDEIATLKQYSAATFSPHENFLKSPNSRLRGMVAGLGDLL